MKIFVTNLLFLVALITCSNLQAQGNVPPPPQNPGEPVPLTGVEYLLIGGAAYGLYKSAKTKSKTS